MSVPIVAIVGFSDSGKTRVAAALVQALSTRGHRVAAFKHAPHGHEPSPPGKDSDKFCAAGAQEVVVSSPGMVTRTVMRSGDLGLEDLVAGLTCPPDIVIAEGFKTSGAPKIVVESQEDLVPYPSNVIARVSHGPCSVGRAPMFTIEQMEDLATFVQMNVLQARHTGDADASGAVSLTVDGVSVPLKEYPACALDEVVRGFLRSLRGVPQDARTIEVRLRRD